MKAMSKQQLAEAAGVSVKVLMNWCRPYREEFEKMGLKPKDRVLPPRIVKFIAEQFCIDVD
jgi:transposase